MKELIVISLGENQYGIWDDEVPEIVKVERLHRLPQSSPFFCGISTIEGAHVGFFDLAACTGDAPLNDNPQPQVIVCCSEQGHQGGFAFEQVSARLQVSDEDVLPMPRAMSCAAISHCVRHNDQPIPLINLDVFYREVCQRHWQPSVLDQQADDRTNDSTGVETLHLFRLAGETYACAEEISGSKPLSELKFCHIPFAPGHVEGISIDRDEVYALLNLATYFGLDLDQASGFVFYTRDGLGFLADEDLGEVKASVLPMPGVVESDIIKQAIVHEGEIIPLVRPRGSLVASQEDKKDTDLHVDSAFPAQFRNQDVDVTQFGLLGTQHGIPSSEVVDLVTPGPIRGIPGQSAIILGVSLYQGELLPVVDLAACFGRRSDPGDDQRMILLENGEFRALVVTDSIEDDRCIATFDQRLLPVIQTHPYLYGCYLADESVRLIFNVETLTRLFEESEEGSGFEQFVLQLGMGKDLARQDQISEIKETGFAGGQADVLTTETDKSEGVAQSSVESGTTGQNLIDKSRHDVEDSEQPNLNHEQVPPVTDPANNGIAASTTTPLPEPGGEVTESEPGEPEQPNLIHEKTPAGDDSINSGFAASTTAAFTDPGGDVSESDSRLDSANPEHYGSTGDSSSISAEPGEDEYSYDAAVVPETLVSDTDETTDASISGAESAGVNEDALAADIKSPSATEGDGSIDLGTTPASISSGKVVSLDPRIDEKPSRIMQPDAARVVSIEARKQAWKGVEQSRQGLDSHGRAADESGRHDNLNRQFRNAVRHYLAQFIPGENTSRLLVALLVVLAVYLIGDQFLSQTTRENMHTQAAVLVEQMMNSASDTSMELSAPLSPETEETEATIINAEIPETVLIETPLETEREIEPVIEPVIEPEIPVPFPSTVSAVTDFFLGTDTSTAGKQAPVLLIEINPRTESVSIREVDAALVPQDYDTYLVVKGDTLWHIARRLTGNPFNYLKIAEESEIKNPDLIFPGQKVFVRIIYD